MSGLSRPSQRLSAVVLAACLWLGASTLAGGAALMIGPRGEIVPLPLSALRGSPFDTYFVPGLILFTIWFVAAPVVVLFKPTEPASTALTVPLRMSVCG